MDTQYHPGLSKERIRELSDDATLGLIKGMNYKPVVNFNIPNANLVLYKASFGDELTDRFAIGLEGRPILNVEPIPYLWQFDNRSLVIARTIAAALNRYQQDVKPEHLLESNPSAIDGIDEAIRAAESEIVAKLIKESRSRQN